MSNKVKFGLRVLGGIAVLLMLGFGLNFVISRLQDQSTAANENTIPYDNNMPVSQPDAGDRLLAFTKVKDGNADIYTIHADGSGLTNITNNPAQDVSPVWSPDGKRIAFTSDRDGFMNLYVMNADGSGLTQLTNNDQPTANAHHEFGVNDQSPWSPDGSKLLFTEWSPDNETWKLYSIDVDGQNKTLLARLPQGYSYPSWSPDGGHIAYIVPESIRGRDMLRIHVVDINGKNDTNVTALLPEDEDLYFFYNWTREGNIRFAANRYYWENDNAKYAFYETAIDGATLVEIAKTSTPLVDWWEGTTFVRGFTGETVTWLRADETYSEFKPYKNCQKKSDFQGSSFSKRSSTGYLIYAAGCPNGDLWLIWANPDGTDIRQLLASPINVVNGGLIDINWSPDGGYITLAVNSSGITYLHMLDVREALKGLLTPPEPIVIGGGDNYYNVSWQPMP